MSAEECARPGCTRPRAPAREDTHPQLAALCATCRTQASSLRSSYGLTLAESIAKVMRPLRPTRGQPRKERAA